jgi:hypothetical protein
MELTPASPLQPGSHVAGKVMDGELVAINLRTGLYYSSSGIGAVIWQLMEAGHTTDSISAAIVARLNVPPDRVRSDVTDFLQRLLEADLVAGTDAPPGVPGDVTIDAAIAYEAPSLTRYDDMEKAFALDPPLRA